MKRAVLVLSSLSSACAVSTHPVVPSKLGVPRRGAELAAQLARPGPVVLESVASADWAVDRGGLLDLDHPEAQAAGLTDGDEPIQIIFHALHHPTRGTFIVDTGVERAQRDDRDHALLRGMVADAMNVDAMRIHAPLGEWLAGRPLGGVLLTHLHADHILGLRDVPRGTRLFAGPGETEARALMNVFVQGLTDEALEGHRAIEEWRFGPRADGEPFAGLIDVLGDGSIWAIWSPGHTPGSTAYLVRTTTGPVLITGDACHTAWGWEHRVEPGTFSADPEESRASLHALLRWVDQHPSIEVRVGHQPMPPRTALPAAQ